VLATIACPRFCLLDNQTDFVHTSLLGTPEVDLVLDALGAGAVLEFLEGEEDSEGFSVDVGGVEDDESEAEAVAELGG